MQDFMRGFLPMPHSISLSESQYPRTRKQREKIKMVLYVWLLDPLCTICYVHVQMPLMHLA
jgi:hypothetical protein